MLKKINNKGFTTVEIVVSFALVVVILASMTALVVNYREKVTNEEVKTQLLDFKDTITKIIYDDIVDDTYTSITSCGDMCIKFSGSEENRLEIKEESGTSGVSKGIYFEYKGIKYFLPDSDLNDYNSYEYIISVNSPIYSSDPDNNLYSVKIPIEHHGINEDYVIQLVVNNYEED